MKPIFMELEGFGPYRHKQRVEFAQLDKLFVITGPTGSGKTTLFDALSYALYGRPLGVRSSVKTKGKADISQMIRCDFCRPQEPTSVRLRFVANGVTWEVFRAPYQPRAKKRGEGLISDSCFTLQRTLDGNTWTPYGGKQLASAIDDYIAAEILQLSYANFAKILVLPQGEFQKFLEDDSKNRGTLLQTLFPVRDHLLLEEIAKQRASEGKKERERLEATLLSQLEALLPEQEVKAMSREQVNKALEKRESHLQRLLTEASDSQRVAAKTRQDAQDALVAAQNLDKWLIERSTLEGQRSTLESRRPQITEAQAELDGIRRASRAMPTLLAQQSLASDITDNDGALISAQHDHEKAVATQQELKEPHTELAEQRRKRIEIDKQCDALTRRQDRLMRRRDLVKALQVASKALQDCDERYTTANASVSKAQKELDELQHVQKERDDLAPRLDRARSQLTTLQKLSATIEVIETFYDDVQPAYQASEKSDADKRQSHQRRITEAELQLSVQSERRAALNLAERLQDNEPCPVCGSREHPNPAAQDNHASEHLAQLDALEQRLEALREANTEFERACAALKGTYNLQRKQAEEAVERIKQSGFTSADQWRSALSTHKASLSDLEQQAAQLNQLLQRRALTMTAHRESKAALEHAQAARYQAQAVHVHKETQLHELQATDGEIDDLASAEVELRQQLQSLQSELTALDSHIQQTDAQWQACQASLAAAKTQLQDAKRRDKSLKDKFQKATAALTQALVDHQFADPEALLAASRSPQREQELERLVRSWRQDLHRIDSRLEELSGHIGQQIRPDLSALSNALDAAKSQDTAATKTHALAQQQFSRFGKDRQAYAAAAGQATRKSAALKGLLTLADHLNADNSRNLTFSDWILGWWLERVLDSANIRLTRLSEGRYRLRRRWLVADRRSRAGLDLDVLDAHTGDPRDVRTLSGGEKFLASISLALGLADVIQSHSGGMEMDTLFIDEGFGSLSDEYRDQVLQVLDELGGTRQVGLITHVADVKSFIPCQVQVSSTPAGSSIHVVH